MNNPNLKEDKTMLFYRYECDCGANFKIINECNDSSVHFCPYCGAKRNDMGDDAFDGQFLYNIKECDIEILR